MTFHCNLPATIDHLSIPASVVAAALIAVVVLVAFLASLCTRRRLPFAGGREDPAGREDISERA